jgi:hypothetical protein
MAPNTTAVINTIVAIIDAIGTGLTNSPSPNLQLLGNITQTSCAASRTLLQAHALNDKMKLVDLSNFTPVPSSSLPFVFVPKFLEKT